MDFTDIHTNNFDTFGETVTYTSPQGDETELTALWQDAEPEQADQPDGQHDIRLATLTLKVADLANPVRNATVKRASTDETWTIQRPPRWLHGALWQIQLRRTRTTEKIAGKYRSI